MTDTQKPLYNILNDLDPGGQFLKHLRPEYSSTEHTEIGPIPYMSIKLKDSPASNYKENY